MSTLEVAQLRKEYGTSVAVDDFSLQVDEGEFIVFLGPSGCGKTTTLRMIAGLVEPTSGRISVSGRDITDQPSYNRNIGVVFQNYALFPHLSVFENVAFGLRRRKLPEPQIASKVREALAMVQMPHLAERRPAELSGGQQQRVAIARAVAIDPALLLLDEPLSNLDAKLRLSVREEIRTLQKTLGITTILVTHDQEEAMSVADRLVIMNEGRIQQIDAPDKVYARPANRFVAEFIGNANCLRGRTTDDGGGFILETGLTLKTARLDPSCTEIVIRPEALRLAGGDTCDADNLLDVSIESTTYLGAGALVRVSDGQGLSMSMHIPGQSQAGWFNELQQRDRLRIHIPRDAIFGLS